MKNPFKAFVDPSLKKGNPTLKGNEKLPKKVPQRKPNKYMRGEELLTKSLKKLK